MVKLEVTESELDYILSSLRESELFLTDELRQVQGSGNGSESLIRGLEADARALFNIAEKLRGQSLSI